MSTKATSGWQMYDGSSFPLATLCTAFLLIWSASVALAETHPKSPKHVRQCWDCEFNPDLTAPRSVRSHFDAKRPTASRRPTRFTPPCGFTYGISYATREVACTIEQFDCIPTGGNGLTCSGAILIQNPSTAIVVSDQMTFARRFDDVDIDLAPSWPDIGKSAKDGRAALRVLRILPAYRRGHSIAIEPVHFRLSQDVTAACDNDDGSTAFVPAKFWVVRTTVAYLPARQARTGCYGDCVMPGSKVCRSAIVVVSGGGAWN